MSTDMTRGNILRQLIQFSIPLILGNLFQLSYNMVDTIVIGRFAGSTALAAVGTCDQVMNLLILGVSGICIGASSLPGCRSPACTIFMPQRCAASGIPKHPSGI